VFVYFGWVDESGGEELFAGDPAGSKGYVFAIGLLGLAIVVMEVGLLLSFILFYFGGFISVALFFLNGGECT
jgi:hypothetical protein